MNTKKTPTAVRMTSTQAGQVTDQIVAGVKQILPDLVTAQIRAELDEWITEVTNEMNRLAEIVEGLQAKLDGLEVSCDE